MEVDDLIVRSPSWHNKHKKKLLLGSILAIIGVTCIVVASFAYPRQSGNLTTPEADSSSSPIIRSNPEVSAAEAVCVNNYAAGHHTISINSGGKTRYFDLFVHEGQSLETRPVVFVYHGFGASPSKIEEKVGMQQNLNSERWYGVYPKGTGAVASWNGAGCCAGNTADDVGFARDIVKWLKTNVCIDTARVYATGFSNGGFMTNRLGCEAADVFHCIAPHSGTIAPDFSCSPSRKVPVLTFHGMVDHTVPYNGGGTSGGLSFPDFAQKWATTNGCVVGSKTEKKESATTTCVTYSSSCTATVKACSIEGLDHNWSGGPSTANSADIQATTAIMNFFKTC